MKNVASLKSPMLITTGGNKRMEGAENALIGKPVSSSTKAPRQQPWSQPGIPAWITEQGNTLVHKFLWTEKWRNLLYTEEVINLRIIRINNGQGHICSPFNKAFKRGVIICSVRVDLRCSSTPWLQIAYHNKSREKISKEFSSLFIRTVKYLLFWDLV